MRGTSTGEEVPHCQDLFPDMQTGRCALKPVPTVSTPLNDSDSVINMVVLGSDCPGPPTYSRRQMKKLVWRVNNAIRVRSEELEDENGEEHDEE